MHFLKYIREQFGADNLGAIHWAHGVNRRSRLKKVLADPATMFVEVDIHESLSGAPVLMHPPKLSSEITITGTPIEPAPEQTFDLALEEFLVSLASTNKGIKLDFKSPRILETSLELVAKIAPSQPVMLHADIVPVAGGPAPVIHNDFIGNCRQLVPKATLSIGWPLLRPS